MFIATTVFSRLLWAALYHVFKDFAACYFILNIFVEYVPTFLT